MHACRELRPQRGRQPGGEKNADWLTHNKANKYAEQNWRTGYRAEVDGAKVNRSGEEGEEWHGDRRTNRMEAFRCAVNGCILLARIFLDAHQ